MKAHRWLLAVGGLTTLVGAMLVFALDNHETKVIGLNLQSVGGVLLVAGLLLLIGLAIGSLGDGSSGGRAATTGSTTPSGGVPAIGGLIAVVSGTIIVGALAAFTMTRLGSGEKDSAIAVASAAFGVISAVIGAYLGIKVTSDHNTDAKNAVLAKNEAETAKEEAEAAKEEADSSKKEAAVAKSEIQVATSMVEEIAPDKAGRVIRAATKAGEETARAPDPGEGDGET